MPARDLEREFEGLGLPSYRDVGEEVLFALGTAGHVSARGAVTVAAR